jgi:TRAP-type C4-dicarboxylate transport system permease large subunit
MEPRGNAQTINANVPLAKMFGYVNSLRSMTQGRAQYTMQFSHYEQIPQQITEAMLSVSKDPYVLLLIVNVMLLIVGMFLDSTTAILVIAPIIAKPLMAAGVDPVHLGMVVVFNLMIGLVTPPMGLSLYLVADIAKVKMRDVLKEMLPFYIPLVGTLVLITYVPWITTVIPRYFIVQ